MPGSSSWCGRFFDGWWVVWLLPLSRSSTDRWPKMLNWWYDLYETPRKLSLSYREEEHHPVAALIGGQEPLQGKEGRSEKEEHSDEEPPAEKRWKRRKGERKLQAGRGKGRKQGERDRRRSRGRDQEKRSRSGPQAAESHETKRQAKTTKVSGRPWTLQKCRCCRRARRLQGLRPERLQSHHLPDITRRPGGDGRSSGMTRPAPSISQGFVRYMGKSGQRSRKPRKGVWNRRRVPRPQQHRQGHQQLSQRQPTITRWMGANGSGGAEVLGGKMGTQEKGEEEAHQGGMGTIMVKRSSRRSRSWRYGFAPRGLLLPLNLNGPEAVRPRATNSSRAGLAAQKIRRNGWISCQTCTCAYYSRSTVIKLPGLRRRRLWMLGGNRSIRQTFGRSREKKITREFWSGSTTVGVRMMRSTLITQLYAQNWKGCTKVPTHFMWNSLDASEVLEREVVLDNDWGKNWVEPRWVGCTVFWSNMTSRPSMKVKGQEKIR